MGGPLPVFVRGAGVKKCFKTVSKREETQLKHGPIFKQSEIFFYFFLIFFFTCTAENIVTKSKLRYYGCPLHFKLPVIEPPVKLLISQSNHQEATFVIPLCHYPQSKQDDTFSLIAKQVNVLNAFKHIKIGL